ncbi:MAG: O-antigen ligase family protein [candidate division NC10 bacterium]|nr:O-antigen ligase family protein [candidate division NC10 bacterium]
MPALPRALDRTQAATLLGIGTLTLLLALFVSHFTPGVALAVGLGVALFVVAFVHTEAALHIIILSMLLSPEILLSQPAAAGSLEASRGVAIRIEDVTLVIVGFSWLTRMAVYKQLGLIRQTPLNGAILLYAVSCIVSTGLGILFGSVRPVTGLFFVLKYLEYFVVYFLVVNHLTEERQLKRFLFTVALTTALVSIFALAQIPAGGRVTAPFEGKEGEPNTLGGYLVFMLAILLGLASESPGLYSRLGWLWLSGLAFLPLLYSLSRASWLATLPMLLTLLLTLQRRGLLLGLLSAALLVGPLLAPEAVIQRIRYTYAQPAERGQVEVGGVRLDTSTSARFESWTEGLAGWSQAPIFGHGVTGFRFMDAQYVRVLVETGLTGFAVFVWLLTRLVQQARRSLTAALPGWRRGLAAGYLAGMVGVMVHGIGANTFIIVRIMEPFWFMTGVIVVLGSGWIGHGTTPPAAGSAARLVRVRWS